MIEFFQDALSQEEQAKLLDSLPVLIFQTDDLIFKQGDPDDDIYFILEGAAKSVTYGPTGKYAYFKTRQAGDFFGYYSATTGQPRTADMIAVGPTRLAKMPAQKFLKLVSENPALNLKLLKLIGNLLRTETERLTNIITLPVTVRIIHDLLKEERQGIVTISSRDEFASKLNMTRESASRCLNDLVRLKAVKLLKNQIVIVDRPFLKKLYADNI